MPAPDLCTITGTAYLPTGEVQKNAYLDVVKVYPSSGAISSEPQQVRSDDGEFSFTLPRDSVAFIKGNIIGWNTASKGHPVEIPDAPTATLESLLPAVTFTVNNVSRGQLETEAAERTAADEDLQEQVDSLDLSGYQVTSEKNQANGYAGLDGSGLVPDNRIPSSIARDSEVTAAIAAEATARSNADALLAPLASPALTGTPTAPTAATVTNTTQLATTAFVQAVAAGLLQSILNSPPGALDTLDELAAALGDDANFAATITNLIALKAPIASPTFTGTVSGVTKAMVGLGSVDNTADGAKPVSTAQQTAIDAASTADRARANHTGTQAISTVTGLQAALDADPLTPFEVRDASDNLVFTITDPDSGTNRRITLYNADQSPLILEEGDGYWQMYQTCLRIVGGSNENAPLSVEGSTGLSVPLLQVLNTTIPVFRVMPNGNIITVLPTSNPGISGALWNDGGTVKVSAG